MHIPLTEHSSVRRFATATVLVMLLAVTASAQGPGRGQTGPFERDYLEFIIDHHFAALRITELAAGTDATRAEAIGGPEGVAPTPGFGASAPKSGMDDVKSMSRRANRAQREEIMTAQKFLRDWYQVSYEPRVRRDAARMIAILEARSAGAAFDQAFLMLFSQHHYSAATSSLDCMVGRELTHQDLGRYCRGIVEAQMLEIDEMRHMLCRTFGVCDFMPFESSIRR